MKIVKPRLLVFLAALLLPNAGAMAQTDAPVPAIVGQVIKSRSVESAIWCMPAVNCDRMRQAALKAGAHPNQMVYWSRPSDWKNQLLTPNPNTIYLMPYVDVGAAGSGRGKAENT